MENIVRRRPTADPAYPGTRILRCAFTGHRPMKMPFGYNEEDPRCIDFKRRLRDTIEMLIWQGYTHFLSGGAMGMDMYAGEIVLDLRQQYPWIALEVAVPFDDQATRWPPEYRKRYQHIIDNADLLLAAYDGQPGGTQMTCDYARKCGVDVCLIKPVLDRVFQVA